MKRNEIAVVGLRGFPGIQGGVEKHSEALYPLITSENFRVYRRKPYVGNQADGHIFPNIRFTDLPSTTIAGFEAFFHTFLCTVSAMVSRPKLVHVHNIGPGLFIPLMKLAGLKVVMTYHSPNYEHSKWGTVARTILRAGEWLSLKFSDRVIFVNKARYEALPDKIKEKSTFIPNGITHHERATDDSLVRKHGIIPGKYILAVGRLTPEKGFEYLVEAASKVNQDYKIVIAGGSDNGDEYMHRLKELDRNDRVVMTGSIQGEELRQIYSHAALFVLSSVNEGFPLVLLEAMDYNLPILASDIPGARLPMLREEHFFPVADPERMAEAINKRLSQVTPLHEEYDLADYDWRKIAEATARQLRF